MPKPRKPYPTFPLTPHIRGGWAKKYKGQYIYISQAESDVALAEYNRRARAIDLGAVVAPPPPDTSTATVGEIATRYCHERAIDQKAGKLSESTLQDYRDAAREMAQAPGRDTLVTDLRPDHFTALQRHWAKRMGSHAMARNIQAIRTLWNHAAANEWIDRMPRFGSIFRKPQLTRKKTVPPTPRQIRALIKRSRGQLRAMILLGINGGYTAKDCAALPISAIDFGHGIIRFPRPKMKNRRPVDRAMTMWVRTSEALLEVIGERPDSETAFRTIHGNPWVRNHTSKKGRSGSIDSVGLMYRRLCTRLKIQADAFSDLRHVHRTIADELEKPHAAARLMGHRLPGLAETYVDRIEHDRLREITDHIRHAVMTARRTAPIRRARPAVSATAISSSPVVQKPPQPKHARASRRSSLP